MDACRVLLEELIRKHHLSTTDVLHLTQELGGYTKSWMLNPQPPRAKRTIDNIISIYFGDHGEHER